MKNNCQKTYKSGLLPLILISALSSSVYAKVNDSIEKTYDFSNTGRIQLENINGDVTIKACDCDQVTLRVDISASSQKMRDRIDIEIKNTSDNLSIKTKYKDNQGSSWHNEDSTVTYVLSVPNDVNLNDIDLVNGDLIISGVTGELDANLVNGSLKSDGLTSSTRVDMVNGNMDIRFSNLTNAKDIDLESVNGDIDIYLPANADASIDAETVSGRISNEFDIEVIKHKYVGSEMNGTIGSGTTKIKLENVNGRIALKAL